MLLLVVGECMCVHVCVFECDMYASQNTVEVRKQPPGFGSLHHRFLE